MEPVPVEPTEFGVTERAHRIATEHAAYAQAHPEIEQLLENLVAKLLVHKPQDALGFVSRHFQEGALTAEEEFDRTNVSDLSKMRNVNTQIMQNVNDSCADT